MINLSTPILKEKVIISFGSAEIRSAWKAWGSKRFTEISSSATVDPANVIFSPASVSPTTYREQITNLRTENIRIREEIGRFRSNVRVSGE